MDRRLGERVAAESDPLSAARRTIDRRRRRERRRLRRARRWRERLAAAAAYVVALNVAAWFSLETPSQLVNVGHMLDGDKIEHLLVFFATAVVVIPMLGRWISAGILAILLTNAGLVVEIVQAYDPAHTADVLDFAADQAGIALGWLASIPLRRRLGPPGEPTARGA